MTECSDIDLDADDDVLNRALLYRDRRDFVIEAGDQGVHHWCRHRSWGEMRM